MVNEVMLVGRLVRDPDVRRTAKGTAVAHFSLATNSRGVDDEGTAVERTEFHEVEAWARLAETVGQVLRRGKLIYLRGQLRSHTWEQDGHRLRSTRILAQDFRILANPTGRRGAPSGQGNAENITADATPSA
jgi:single-strand DNA-binding protein